MVILKYLVLNYFSTSVPGMPISMEDTVNLKNLFWEKLKINK